MKSEKTKYFLELLIIIVIFLTISYIVQSNLDFFKKFLGNGYWGILAYILIGQIAMVFAPISSMPLIPVVSQMMGPFYASIINVFSWTLGSVLVFFISRKWGVALVKKIIPLKDIYKLENKIPKENQFWSIFLLRIIFPVDLISYALGILSNVKFKPYFYASLLGIIPKAFMASYFGYADFRYQLAFFLIIGVVGLFLIILGHLLDNMFNKKH
ncbi:TVP38/TMEM64 family protein [Candidatus Pacearchaeota archaeon]|nr:TVP38/TMEM64 family protein [Candidatus Pacearchaeota archaeon]